MVQGQEYIDDLVKALDDAIEAFNSDMPKAEKEMFVKVLNLTKDFDLNKDGSIKVTVKNFKLIRQIDAELNKAILNDKYIKQVREFTKAFDSVDKFQNLYFSELINEYTPLVVFNELKQLSIDSVIENLTESGLRYSVTNKAKDILIQSIKKGGKYSDMIESMRAFLIADGQGALSRYASGITTDALYQYSAQYSAMTADDLGLKWFVWFGGIQKTSRQFCKVMLEQQNTCQEYWHVSQIPQLLKGRICDVQVHINSKTGFPDGFKDITTVSNFQYVRGGYSCKHKMLFVSSAVVPKELRKKFE